ncbi:MAG: GAF domain-containing protein [Verrucomicrobia bacterium]|nr:GAF domain-containing protein [Verrucomicrobiota bacterium]
MGEGSQDGGIPSLSILESVSDPFLALDSDRLVTFLNASAARLLGRPVEDSLGRPLSDVFPEDCGAAFDAKCIEVERTGKPARFDASFYARNNSHVSKEWYEAWVSPWAKGFCVHLLHTTGRRQADAVMAARLRLLERAPSHSLAGLLRATLDEAEALTGSSIGFYHFVDPDQNSLSLQVWSTNTVERMCGAKGSGLHYPLSKAGVWVDCIRDRRPVIHNDYASLPHRKGLPEGHAPVIRELVVPVMRSNRIVAVLGVGNKPSGYDERDVEMVTSLADLGWDIAENKRTQETLQMFKTVFELSDEAIAITNSAGEFLYINPAHERLFGRSIEEARGMTYREYYPPESIELLDRVVAPAMARGENWEGELEALDSRGRRFPLWQRAGVVQDADGKILYCYRLMHDITAARQAKAEEKRAEAIIQQIQKSESLSRMASAISHHFNNQLQVVMGSLEMSMGQLQRGGNGTGELLTDAMLAARRASQLSGAMLTYLGNTCAKQEPLDLADACRKNLPLLVAVVPKDVTLETDLGDLAGPVVKVNASQVRQVLTHLVTNAWESCGGKPGRIRLSVKVVDPAEVPAAHRFPIGSRMQVGPCACLEIGDTGSGIPPKDLDNIFDPFFSTKFTGRGMGLAVVLGIVRAHEGSITVESELGRGSIFRVYLPLSVEAAARPPEIGKLARGGSEGTVLLVEDDLTVQRLAARMLVKMGFAVIQAGDGVEAVELFAKRKGEIGWVLCDLTMPRMNGWETLAALRNLDPGIPVVLASGYDYLEVISGDHPEWPQAFLSKPYGLQQLKNVIGQVLPERKEGAERG